MTRRVDVVRVRRARSAHRAVVPQPKPGTDKSYGRATSAFAQSSPFAVTVTSVPPTYGPVLLSMVHSSVICAGFKPEPSAEPGNSELTQSKHPGCELSKRNLRNVPEPFVYTRGHPENCRPSFDTVTCAVLGVRRLGVTHRPSLSLTYTSSTSSNSFSVAKRHWVFATKAFGRRLAFEFRAESAWVGFVR